LPGVFCKVSAAGLDSGGLRNVSAYRFEGEILRRLIISNGFILYWRRGLIIEDPAG